MANEPTNVIIRETLGAFCGLRRLGFPNGDIHFIVSPNEHGVESLFVSLRTQGKEFNVEAGPAPDEAEFKDALEWWGDGQDRAKYDSIWTNCVTYHHTQDLLMPMILQGFHFPATPN